MLGDMPIHLFNASITIYVIGEGKGLLITYVVIFENIAEILHTLLL
jgi:hypothetical protein